MQKFHSVLKLRIFVLKLNSVIIFTISAQSRLPAFFLELNFSFNQLFFVSLNLPFEVADGFLLLLVLSLQLLLFLRLKFKKNLVSLIRLSFACEVLFKSLVLVAKIDDI